MTTRALPADLAAAIVAAPDDPATRAVAADWLQQHGDPLGELVALSLADDPRLHARRIEHLRHAVVPRPGFSLKDDWQLGWRWGFAEQVTCTAVDPRHVAYLAHALASPALGFLRALAFMHGFADDVDHAALLAAVPATLRVLSAVSTGAAYPRVYPLPWARVPDLARLAIRTDRFAEPIDAPALEELIAVAPDLALLADARAPRLRALALSLPAIPDPHALAAALAPFPQLRRLAIGAPELYGQLAGFAPPATVDTFELVDTAHFGPGRRRLVIDRAPATPHAALLFIRRDHGRALVLDPRRTNVMEGGRIEFTGVDWWLRDATTTSVDHWPHARIPLRDGDELTFHATSHIFVAAPTEAALAARLAALRTRYGFASS